MVLLIFKKMVLSLLQIEIVAPLPKNAQTKFFSSATRCNCALPYAPLKPSISRFPDRRGTLTIYCAPACLFLL